MFFNPIFPFANYTFYNGCFCNIEVYYLDTHLYKLCDEAGIKHFCMHALRHTYATRAIECGMQPKVLQKLLGHASIKTTMDRYVHVTDSSMADAVRLFGTLQLESA